MMGLPDGVREWTSKRSVAKESDSEYDGAFSSTREWHSATHGLYKGVTTKPWRTPPEPDVKDVRKERYYYRGCYLIGTLLQILMVLGLARLGYPAMF